MLPHILLQRKKKEKRFVFCKKLCIFTQAARYQEMTDVLTERQSSPSVHLSLQHNWGKQLNGVQQIFFSFFSQLWLVIVIS